jgi:hypothetical protein
MAKEAKERSGIIRGLNKGHVSLSFPLSSQALLRFDSKMKSRNQLFKNSFTGHHDIIPAQTEFVHPLFVY